MDRRTFLHHGCLACLASLTAPLWLSACSTARAITGTLEGDDLVVPVSAFTASGGAPKAVIVATHPQLKQPIAVFREDAGYRAVLMRCTHRGVELHLTGSELECPAHGSRFDAHGTVLHGPASIPLRVLPATERDGRVLISLKA